MKSIFIVFKELSVSKNFLRPQSGPLIWIHLDSYFVLRNWEYCSILDFNEIQEINSIARSSGRRKINYINFWYIVLNQIFTEKFLHELSIYVHKWFVNFSG